MGYLEGFGITIRKWLGPGTDTGRRVTSQYPEQTRPKPERFHGRHVLNRYEDGMEKCIGCELCAGVCPAKCIYVRGADNDPDDPTSPGERFGFIYEINYLRCIHCDLCVEACPTEAITETKLFEFAFTNRSDAIYTKSELVVGDDGRPQQLPWENWDGGFDPAQDASGWMRATAPSGDAEFNGIVAWAGELGFGVRAPEGGGRVQPDLADEVVPEPSPEPAGPLGSSESLSAAERSARGLFDAGDGVARPAPRSATAPVVAPEPEAPVEVEPLPMAPTPEQTPGPMVEVEGEPAANAAEDDAAPMRGAFDAPELPSAPTSRFGRRRDRGAGTPPVSTGPTDEEIVESLPESFGAPAPETDGGPDESEDEDAATTDASDQTAEGTDAPAGAAPEPAPRAGTFDAPELPEEPKGRRFRRRGDR